MALKPKIIASCMVFDNVVEYSVSRCLLLKLIRWAGAEMGLTVRCFAGVGMLRYITS